MKVYTKTGDKGTTSLVGGERVAKNDLRVEAYGTVDELTAFAALLSDKMRTNALTAELSEDINRINSVLMSVEAHLAAGDQVSFKLPVLSDSSIAFLESRIDTMQAEVPAIAKFTIPGGHEFVSLSHVCRTVCRRAERCSIAASEQYKIDDFCVTYLNRLSDYFYLLGRVITARLEVEETLWIPESEK